MSENKKENIGYIGLGIMGAPAAGNLLAAGHNLRVWARRRQSAEPLLAKGAAWAASPAALAAECDYIFTNVSDSADVEEVALGEGGIVHGVRQNAIVADMSTTSPQTARRAAAAFAKVGAHFLDTPVSGGEAGAINAALTFMAGGDSAAFARIKPLLLVMGKSATLIGGAGAGQTAKACNQMIIGATLCGIADSFALARANNVSLERVREALLGGFAASKVLEAHALRMINNDFAPGFKTRLHHKDIRIAIAEAKEKNLQMRAAEDFLSRLQKLMDSGDGELDSAAVGKAQ